MIDDPRLKPFKIFWLVGENSGDLHAAQLMKKINDTLPYATHVGIGGKLMQNEGLRTLFPFEKFSIMGFVEVLAHLSFIFKVERTIKQLFKKEKPDLAILVDYPGLNLRVAFYADEARIPVLYYICPQFWAWKHKRVYKLRESVRHVAAILPFEKELLDIHNVTATYVGHPIAEEVHYELDRGQFARFYGLDPGKKWLGFFPGSRNTEIQRLLPIYLETIKHFDPDEYEFLFSKARSVSHQNYLETIALSKVKMVKVIDGYNYEMMKYCDFLVLKSGTTTLEAAYIGTPMLIVYKASALSYLIGKQLVRVKYIGLPNLILDKALLPELVQDDVNPTEIKKQIEMHLSNPQLYNHIRRELEKIRAILSEKRASDETMKIVRKLLKIDA